MRTSWPLQRPKKLISSVGRNGGHLTPSPSYQFKSIAEMASVEDAKKEVHLEDRATNWVLETCEAEGWEEDVDLVRGGCVSSPLAGLKTA